MRWFVNRRLRILESRLAYLKKEDKLARDLSVTTEEMMDGVAARAQEIAQVTTAIAKLNGTWELRKEPRNGDRT